MTVLITTVGWVLVTALTRPTDQKTLVTFLERSGANGPGWKHVIDQARRDGTPLPESDKPWGVPLGLLCSLIGCVAVYAVLFAMGFLLYGKYLAAVILLGVAALSCLFLFKTWKRVTA